MVYHAWFVGICGLGINDGFVGFRRFMGLRDAPLPNKI